MNWQELIENMYSRQSQEMEMILDGLTLDELNQRPAPDLPGNA